jgi:DNA end-binding protein Ku
MNKGRHRPRGADNREHIIALEPLDKGLMGTLLRYRTSPRGYFDEIQDVKVTKDMLDLASTSSTKSGRFSPTSSRTSTNGPVDPINQSAPANRSRRRSAAAGNVVDLWALRRASVGHCAGEGGKPAKKRASERRRKC